jgi:hypothetical protein
MSSIIAIGVNHRQGRLEDLVEKWKDRVSRLGPPYRRTETQRGNAEQKVPEFPMSWVKEGQGCARRTEACSSEPTDSVPTHVANLPHDTRQGESENVIKHRRKEKGVGRAARCPRKMGKRKTPPERRVLSCEFEGETKKTSQ